MSVARDVRLPPHLVAIKLACARAVEAAGGQALVAREVARSQSRICDYCSVNTADFMPIDVALMVDAMAAGSSGHAPISAAMARHVAGNEGGSASVDAHLPIIAAESADLIRLLAQKYRGDLSIVELRALLREADDLAEAVADLARDAVVGDAAVVDD